MAVFTAVYVIAGGYKAGTERFYSRNNALGIAAVVLAVLGENGGLGNSF